jgi:hypothetical protein
LGIVEPAALFDSAAMRQNDPAAKTEQRDLTEFVEQRTE